MKQSCSCGKNIFLKVKSEGKQTCTYLSAYVW
ncbi:hypothetical protein T11_14989 [Trichinella zimbabwensis]|uniref:Uncharacterized protein n=1 Tax=Trichinella zimbabwensis TaxID=268475 RepID=A0A0V1GB72_9BILA|nr:hypothetical protein T11_14989 [Trichinella zimbabwensis]